MYERVATSPSCDMIVGDVQVGQIWKCPSLLFFELQQFEQYKTAKSYASKLLVWNRAPHGIHASGIKQCYRVILVARQLYDIGRLCPFLRMGQPQISRWIYDPSGCIIVAGELPHIGNIRSVCFVLYCAVPDQFRAYSCQRQDEPFARLCNPAGMSESSNGHPILCRIMSNTELRTGTATVLVGKRNPP
jgi:hypothetical protein